MLNKSVRLKALIIVVSISLFGCSTLEKNILSKKNIQNEEQKKPKIEKKELATDEHKVLLDIEKNLKNITLNIVKLSDENTKTFEKISSKVNKLEATVTRLEIILSSKEEMDKKTVLESNSINQFAREEYQAAFELLKEGDYETARSAFIDFIDLYKDSEFLDDAKYWLAETYYAQRAYAKALEEFENIQKQFPDSGKIPETILKSGFCYLELGNIERAKQILNLVTSQYPNTSVARLAVQKLKTINSTSQ